jgi:toxin ParE1/3/4
VILSPLAVQDLAEIVTFIAADNPPVAARFGRALVQKTRLLITFPELGRIVPELEPAEHARELVHRAHRIICRVDHARHRVEVARFWHAARGTPQV